MSDQETSQEDKDTDASIRTLVDVNNLQDYFIATDGKLIQNRRKGDKVLERLTLLENGHKSLHTQLESNTALTQYVANNTKELIDILNGVKGMLKVLAWLIPLCKWVSSVGGAAVLIYVLFKGHPKMPSIDLNITGD